MKSKKPTTSSTKRSTKKLSLSLRTKLYNKYKPPPKTLKSANTSSTSAGKPGTSTQSHNETANDSESSSSDSENFIDPNDIDLNSKFFDKGNANAEDNAPNFDCNAGLQISDSGSDGDEDTPSGSNDGGKTSGRTGAPSTDADLSKFHEYSSNLEKAKSQLKKAKFAPTGGGDDQLDISKILAMGEGSSTVAKVDKVAKKQPAPPAAKVSKTKRKKVADDSDDSDWEEVEGKKRNKTRI